MSNPVRGWLVKHEDAWIVIVFICLALFIVGLSARSLFRPRMSIHREFCSNNLHQLGLTIDRYTRDHKGQYPDPDKWPGLMLPYVKSQGIYKCPKTDYQALRKYHAKYGSWEGFLVVTYAMNERLKGLSVKDVRKPEETVLLFESTGEKLSGGPELVPKETRHEKRRYVVVHQPFINVLFADWKVRAVPLDQVPSLKWDPK